MRRSGNSLGKLSQASLSSEINVTPLVDVVLVLLIIFMVVTPLIQKGVPVNLPVTKDPERTPESDKQLLISVKADGTVYVGPLVIRKDEMEPELKKIFDETPEREVAVKGDREGKYGDVLRVLRAARDAGFSNVGLISQPESRAGEGG